MKNLIGFIAIILFSAGLVSSMCAIIYLIAIPTFKLGEFGVIIGLAAFCVSAFALINRKYTFI
jgi:hypothetical protein